MSLDTAISGRKRALGWVAGSQVLTVLGTVVGIRVLTQHLDPSTFGVVTLAVGAAALAMNVFCTPLTQAAMYFYPSLAATGEVAGLPPALWHALRRAAPWLAGAAALFGWIYAGLGSGSLWIVLATIGLLVCDCWRSVNLCLLNAASMHRRYGIWLALEAWGRPLCATGAVLVFGGSSLSVLCAYIGVSLLLNLALSRHPGMPSNPAPNPGELDRKLWQYGLPLVPLGLIGWANGLSDRYIIGALLSLQDTGIYAAVYGLASRPLLAINAALEQFFRPLYQSSVSQRRTGHASALLRWWLIALMAANAIVVLVAVIWKDTLAQILLGPRFRSGAMLIPWISAGYALLSTSYVFSRICYAHAQTRRVLTIEVLSGITALVTTTIGVLTHGLLGAAMAVPVYFGVQLGGAIILGKRSLDEGKARQLQLGTHGTADSAG